MAEDGVDRISGLPEGLLLQVLARLGCAREAARTAVLARRWRGLSTQLPEYTFRDMAPESVDAALAKVTRLKLDRLDIAAELSPETACGRASSLLLAAARLEPDKLSVNLTVPTRFHLEVGAIELPGFDRTRSLFLRLPVPITSYYGPVEQSFAQEIVRLQVADFSVLRLVIKSRGHAFGPLLLHLLQIRLAIRRLELELSRGKPEQCPQDCPCLQPADWKNENISLNDLKEVTISYSFPIGDKELDFLKLLFRCAPTLKRMKVGGVAGEGFIKVQKIYEENPHVECYVNAVYLVVVFLLLSKSWPVFCTMSEHRCRMHCFPSSN